MPFDVPRVPAGPGPAPGPTGPPRNSPPQSPDALHKACQDFESIFVSMIFRQAVNAARIDSGDNIAGASVFDMLGDQAFAGHIARSGGFGLAAYLYRLLSTHSSEPALKAGENGR